MGEADGAQSCRVSHISKSERRDDEGDNESAAEKERKSRESSGACRSALARSKRFGQTREEKEWLFL